MSQFIFIIIIIVILILLKFYYFCEKFESSNQIENQLSENGIMGIYNYFYQQVLNPYKYSMTPFFSNNTQELPKPSPKHSDY